MQRLAIFAICLLHIALGVHSEGHYSVIGPGTLHSEHKYNVAVAVHNTKEPSTLKVGITGPSYNESKLVELNTADEVKLVEFDLPELESGNYNLTAEGVQGIAFHNTTKLNLVNFQPHISIQTDKGVYKPGDKVQFRIIFLDENLRPTEVKPSTIAWVEDSKRNRLKEYKNLKLAKGVYTDTFQISEYPVLGNWHIMVKTGGKQNSNQQVSFQVDKYVLPKYEVKVEITERVSVLDGDMHAVIRANYTYGKPVNGKAILVFEFQKHYWYGMDSNTIEDIPALIKTADMVNGKAKFDFNVKEYQSKISKKYATHVNVVATVEEEFTGVKLNGSTYSTLYPNRYQMSCDSYDTCSRYYADKEAKVIYQILHVDGSMVADTKTVVRLTYTEVVQEQMWYNSDKPKATSIPAPEELQKFVFESHLNATSHAEFLVTLPDLAELDGYQHYFVAVMEFAEQKDEVVSAYPYRKEEIDAANTPMEVPKEFFNVNLIYQNNSYSVKMGEESTVTVNSSRPFSYFVYTVVGRGNIIKVERVELPEPTKIYTFKIIPTYEMAPSGKIYVHYVDDGELYFDETTFYIDWEFENKITIEAAEEVKVGEEVALNIKTEPNSFVGLLGVDQSNLLLKEYNDVTEDHIRWRLGQYSTYTPHQGGYSKYPGGVSGLVTLTNAHYEYNHTNPWHALGEPQSFSANSDIAVNRKTTLKTALSAGGGAVLGHASPGMQAAPVVRKDFAETWIFANIENTEKENFTWIKKIPDTITSWVVTAFSLNAEKGFASTKDKTKIRTFQPFFISVRLPYSVKRGEVINVPALVFNYLGKELEVEITLDNTDDEFEFTEVSNEVIEAVKRTKTVRVPANTAKGVSFMLRPKVIGDILLKFTAISPVAGDAVHRALKVVPEGVTEYANRAYFVNLKNMPELKETFDLELPADIVPDSQHAEFSVVGDLLGPMLNNLDVLVRMPTGCGEQTMSKFVPNYLVLRYLTSTNKLTPALESRIKNNLEHGYQNILHYQHEDGSFSSFGPSNNVDETPRNGSTWLTAYVVRFLLAAESYVKIDPKVVSSGLAYLTTRQADNGSFTEKGDIFYHSQRNEVTLTATVLLAFLENSNNVPPNLEKSIQFIMENMDKTKDLRAKAVATFALQQAKHPKVSEKLADLKAFTKTDGDRMWWPSSETEDSSSNNLLWRWWRWPRSDEVEVTSYALLSLLDQESETEQSVLPIIKWLVAQRNSYGGFASTQDTVVGLQALIKFAEKSKYEAANMEVDFKSQGGDRQKSESLKIGEDNALLMQTFELPAKSNSIEFHAKGTGAALVQVSYQYNILEKEKKPSFTLKTNINKKTSPHHLEMDVCVEYVGENGESNMAVLEISMPSGYVIDVDSIKDLLKIERVRKIESKNADTKMIVYFESLRKDDPKCLIIDAFKSYAVAMQKPAPIVVYDYYDTSKKATTYYEVVSKLCDICDRDEEECEQACE